jgi:hypothetical protein
MFNADTLDGGLFHYAARSTAQHPQLIEMYKAIDPTWIGVNRRPNRRTFPPTYGEDDYESLIRFFAYRLGVKEDDIGRIPQEGNSYAVFLGDDEKLEIRGTVPGETAEPRFDATRLAANTRLNPEVALLVNRDIYTNLFATKG